MKKVAIVVIAILGILGGFYYYKLPQNIKRDSLNTPSETTQKTKSVNYKANFLIYTNGTLRIFTDSRYHNQSDEVFINSDLPNQVTVLKDGTTWRDFFNTLPMKLEESCLITGTEQTFCNNNEFILQFYINGIRNQKALDEIINDKDKLLITYESLDSSIITNQINSLMDTN